MGLTNIQKILKSFILQTQDDEDMFFDLLEDRSIFTAEGVQLDGIGDILGLDRAGRNDTDYRTRLFIRIAELYSEGTIEDLIALYAQLMDPEVIEYREQWPANFTMLAKNPNPIGSDTEVRNAIQAAKPAGVGFDLFESTEPAFAFLGDPDPDTDGFSSVAAPATGGILASVL